MPTIKNVKPGVWDCVWWAGGKQWHRRIKAKSGSDAMKKMGEISKQKETALEKPELSWESGMNLFLQGNCGLKTEAKIVHDIKALIEFLGGDKPIKNTTRGEFVDFTQNISNKSSASTADRYRREILSVCRWLRRAGKIENIPFEHIPQLKVTKKKRRALPFE